MNLTLTSDTEQKIFPITMRMDVYSHVEFNVWSGSQLQGKFTVPLSFVPVTCQNEIHINLV